MCSDQYNNTRHEDPESQEADLVRRAIAGGDDGRAAFDVLYKKYRDEVTRHVRRISRKLSLDLTTEDIEDIVQITGVTAYSERSNIKYPRKFTAWLCAIARFEAIDFFDRKCRRLASPIDDRIQDPSSPARFSEIDSVVDRDRKLDNIAKKYPRRNVNLLRLIVVLKWDGYSLEEIAECLKMQAATIRQVWMRFKSMLRTEWDNENLSPKRPIGRVDQTNCVEDTEVSATEHNEQEHINESER